MSLLRLLKDSIRLGERRHELGDPEAYARPMRVAALTLRILFFSYATGLIMWRRSDVTIDTIAGAACAYTLLALVWGSIYVLLEFLRPGSFLIPAAWRIDPSGDPGAALVHVSFVTLTAWAMETSPPCGQVPGVWQRPRPSWSYSISR